jgi:predicted HTH domain antitoxin
MTINIPDQYLQEAQVTDREVLIETACRLFAAQKLFKSHAARLAGLSRAEFEEELIKRDLPLIIYDEEMFEQDLLALKRLEEMRIAGHQ